jgi:hypothetical protein
MHQILPDIPLPDESAEKENRDFYGWMVEFGRVEKFVPLR